MCVAIGPKETDIIMTIENIIPVVAILVAMITFIITQIVGHVREQKLANRETYQRLEIAAIDLSRFEASHLEVIRPIWEESVPVPNKGTAEYAVTFAYVCQILSLFEMAIRLRKEKVFPSGVFGSWVIWYYEVANGPHFEEIWHEAMFSYTDELRSIMNKGISLKHTVSGERTRCKGFFSYVAEFLKCKEISEWLEQVQKEERNIVVSPE
jgi:hypothetical protein